MQWSTARAAVCTLAPRSGERVASAHERVYARLRRAMGASRVRGRRIVRRCPSPGLRFAQATLSPLRGARVGVRGELGLYPPPCGEGRREAPGWGWCDDARLSPHNSDPHPQPLPTRGRGAHRVCRQCVVPQQRCAPSPRRGEGWGEGGRLYRESITPHPTPLPMGEGADRVCGEDSASKRLESRKGETPSPTQQPTAAE
jgi:hypothetical protein